jgi:hypothetical protein
VASVIRRILSGVTAIFESRVTRVARFATLPESVGGFSVGSESSDRHFHPVAFPGLVSSASATIFFRVRPLKADTTIQVRLNQTIAVRFTYDEPSNTPFHWHKVLPARALLPDENELIFSVSGPLAPTAEFSDVVILYQSSETTVKEAGPTVLDS